MTTATAKISSKGQITLPAAMRRALATDRVRLQMKDGTITLTPEVDLGGSLAKYAKGKPDLKRETEVAWAAVAREYEQKNPRR